MGSYGYSCISCVVSDARSITDMVDRAREVSYDTFRRRCPDLPEFAERMGYNKRSGLTLRQDHYVRYYRSKFRGRPCYFLDHSAIEYIWLGGRCV